MVFGQYVEFVNYQSVLLCIYVTDMLHAGNRGRWLWWYSPLNIRSFHIQPHEPSGCVMSSDLPWMSEPSDAVLSTWKIDYKVCFFLLKESNVLDFNFFVCLPFSLPVEFDFVHSGVYVWWFSLDVWAIAFHFFSGMTGYFVQLMAHVWMYEWFTNCACAVCRWVLLLAMDEDSMSTEYDAVVSRLVCYASCI